MRTPQELLTLVRTDTKFMRDLVDEMADAAFVPVVAAFPEITTGDFGPDDHFALEQALRNAVRAWVEGNLPVDEVEQ